MVADLTSVCPETTPVVGPAFITVSEVIAQCLVSLSAPVDTSTPATTTKAAPPTTPKSTQRPAPTIGAQCRDGEEKHYEVCAGHKEWVGGQVETGMRPGELAGLHAHRVDVTRQRVWISDVYVRRMHAIRSTPKNGHARSVPLTRKALEIIQRRLDGRDSKAGCGVRHLDNKRCRHPLVFLNAHGGVINSDILQRRMNKAAKAAGLEPKNPYAARRGYATWLADGGLDTFQIQRLLGHADLEESKDVQESPAVAARTLDALGDTPKLRVVGDDETRGPRGPQRGPDFDNQPLPEVPSASGQFSL